MCQTGVQWQSLTETQLVKPEPLESVPSVLNWNSDKPVDPSECLLNYVLNLTSLAYRDIKSKYHLETIPFTHVSSIVTPNYKLAELKNNNETDNYRCRSWARQALFDGLTIQTGMVPIVTHQD